MVLFTLHPPFPAALRIMSTASRTVSLSTRLQAYRPFLDRFFFVIAMIGVLATVHLKVQQDRGFDRGCLGFSDPATVQATFDCDAVTRSRAGTMFGISNAILGMFFYLGIAGLCGGIAYTSGSMRQLLKRIRLFMIVAGFAYSLYLSYYQYAEVGEFCLLCLISALLVTTLFILLMVEVFASVDADKLKLNSGKLMKELSMYGGLAVLIFVLVGADLAYFGSLEDPNEINFEQAFDDEPTTPEATPVTIPEGTEPEAATASAAEAEPVPVEHVALSEDCIYDPEKDPVRNFAEQISMADAFKGEMGASVVVVEYFDPMCPHCKTMHPIMKEIAASHGDRAQFVYKPVALISQASVLPVAALHVAAQNGKFFEMLDLIFANQKPQGYSLQELRGYATQVGIDPDVMEGRMRGGIYNPTMKRERDRFVENGFTSVPTVMINGRVVESHSRSVDCLGQMIDAARAEAQ